MTTSIAALGVGILFTVFGNARTRFGPVRKENRRSLGGARPIGIVLFLLALYKVGEQLLQPQCVETNRLIAVTRTKAGF